MDLFSSLVLFDVIIESVASFTKVLTSIWLLSFDLLWSENYDYQYVDHSSTSFFEPPDS